MATPSAPGNNTQSEANTRCVWSSSDDSIMVRVLRHEKEVKGNQSGAGWKPQVWTAVALAIEREGVRRGAPKNARKCSDHWANLKKNFLEVDAIRQCSGFGWDDGTKTCTATADVWARYIAAHPSAARWKTTPFPLYDDMYFLVNGIVATGAGAFRAGRSLSPTESASSTDGPDHGSDSGECSQEFPGILHDDVAQEIMEPTTPAAPKSRKRTRADTESPPADISASSSYKKGKGKCRVTAADSVAGTILQMSQSLNVPKTVPTPERRQRAINLLCEDQFIGDDAGELILCFAENIGYADAYSGTKDKPSRINFAQKVLQKRRV